MSFFESPRFPDNIARGATGGPMFSTVVVATVSGKESRNSQWAYPLHSWDVSQGVNSQASFESLRAFFMSVRGRQHGFRFKDWTDYAATHTTGFVTGITSTTFQLVKRYTSGAQTQDRKIVKPLAGIEVKVSGVVTAHTLDTVTGIVTIGSAPAAANVTWSGEFDVPMRFDSDTLQASVVGRNLQSGLLHRWDAIRIVELRL
jgi:uncharacterized protein (TIGR02217 family)